MTRLFHAKISLSNYVLLSALLAVAIYFLWQVNNDSRPAVGVVFTLILFLMVVIVEKMINTTYTVTSGGELIVHNGRFSKDITIHVSDITSIDRIDRWSIGGHSLYSYLLVVTRDGREIAVRPNNEDDFVKKINILKSVDDENEDDDEYN